MTFNNGHKGLTAPAAPEEPSAGRFNALIQSMKPETLSLYAAVVVDAFDPVVVVPPSTCRGGRSARCFRRFEAGSARLDLTHVMAGLVPAIHDFAALAALGAAAGIAGPAGQVRG